MCDNKHCASEHVYLSHRVRTHPLELLSSLSNLFSLGLADALDLEEALRWGRQHRAYCGESAAIGEEIVIMIVAKWMATSVRSSAPRTLP